MPGHARCMHCGGKARRHCAECTLGVAYCSKACSFADSQLHELEHLHRDRQLVAARLELLTEQHTVVGMIKRQSEALAEYRMEQQNPKRQRVKPSLDEKRKAASAAAQRERLREAERKQWRQKQQRQEAPPQEEPDFMNLDEEPEHFHRADEDSDPWLEDLKNSHRWEQLRRQNAEWDGFKAGLVENLRLSRAEVRAWEEQNANISRAALGLAKGMFTGKMNRDKYQKQLDNAVLRIQQILSRRSDDPDEPETDEEWIDRVGEKLAMAEILRDREDRAMNSEWYEQNQQAAEKCQAKLDELTRQFHPELVGAPSSSAAEAEDDLGDSEYEEDADGQRWLVVSDLELVTRLRLVNRARYHKLNPSDYPSESSEFQVTGADGQPAPGKQVPLDKDGQPISRVPSGEEVAMMYNELRELMTSELEDNSLETAVGRWIRIQRLKATIPQTHPLLEKALRENPSIHPRWRFRVRRVYDKELKTVRLETRILMRVSITRPDTLEEVRRLLDNANQQITVGYSESVQSRFSKLTTALLEKVGSVADKVGGVEVAGGFALAASVAGAVVIGMIQQAAGNTGPPESTLNANLKNADLSRLCPDLSRPAVLPAPFANLQNARDSADTRDRIQLAVAKSSNAVRSRLEAHTTMSNAVTHLVEENLRRLDDEQAPLLANEPAPSLVAHVNRNYALVPGQLEYLAPEDSNPFSLAPSATSPFVTYATQTKMFWTSTMQQAIQNAYPGISPEQVSTVEKEMTSTMITAFEATATKFRPFVELSGLRMDPSQVFERAEDILTSEVVSATELFSASLAGHLGGLSKVRIPREMFEVGLRQGLGKFVRQMQQNRVYLDKQLNQLTTRNQDLALARMSRVSRAADDSLKRYPEANSRYLERIEKGDTPLEARFRAQAELSDTNEATSLLSQAHGFLRMMQPANPTMWSRVKTWLYHALSVVASSISLVIQAGAALGALQAAFAGGAVGATVWAGIGLWSTSARFVQALRSAIYTWRGWRDPNRPDRERYSLFLSEESIRDYESRLARCEDDTSRMKARILAEKNPQLKAKLRAELFGLWRQRYWIRMCLFGFHETLIAPFYESLSFTRKFNRSVFVAELTYMASVETVNSIVDGAIPRFWAWLLSPESGTRMFSTDINSLPVQVLSWSVPAVLGLVVLYKGATSKEGWGWSTVKTTAKFGQLPFSLIRGIWDDSSPVSRGLFWWDTSMWFGDLTSHGLSAVIQGPAAINNYTPKQILDRAFRWTCDAAPGEMSTMQRGLARLYLMTDGLDSSPFDYALKRLWLAPRDGAPDFRGMLPESLLAYARRKWGDDTDEDIARSYLGATALGQALGLHNGIVDAVQEGMDPETVKLIKADMGSTAAERMNKKQWQAYQAEQQAYATEKLEDPEAHLALGESFADAYSAWTADASFNRREVEKVASELYLAAEGQRFDRRNLAQVNALLALAGQRKLTPDQFARVVPPLQGVTAQVDALPPIKALPSEAAAPTVSGRMAQKSSRTSRRRPRSENLE